MPYRVRKTYFTIPNTPLFSSVQSIKSGRIKFQRQNHKMLRKRTHRAFSPFVFHFQLSVIILRWLWACGRQPEGRDEKEIAKVDVLTAPSLVLELEFSKLAGAARRLALAWPSDSSSCGQFGVASVFILHGLGVAHSHRKGGNTERTKDTGNCWLGLLN